LDGAKGISMHIVRALLKLLTESAIMLIILAICIVSVVGVTLPEHPELQAVGPFQLGIFSIDLALYQPLQNTHYYSMSPFNDYLITASQDRQALLSLDELRNKSFQLIPSYPFDQKLAGTLMSYLQLTSPKVTLKGSNTITYWTSVRGNNLTVYRQIEPLKNVSPIGVASTLSFDPEDYVFDSQGHLYTEKSPAEIALFQRLYNIVLTPNNSPDPQLVADSKVIIVNPHLTGQLVITKDANQLLQVDTRYGLVELIQPLPKNYQSTQPIITHLSIKTSDTVEVK
jgi:hypothetical protein